ncbi:MAG: hypothetical protein WC399_04005 [Bacilli bacterium]|jgi:hypothetical protein
MPKYDVEFKKKCIKPYEEGKPLPNVAGVLPSSMMRFVTEWRLLFTEQGEKVKFVPCVTLSNIVSMKYNLNMAIDYGTLAKNGDYETIIKLSENRLDLDSLMVRFQALAVTGADEEALALIDAHFDIMKERIAAIFIEHRDLLMKSGDRAVSYKWLRRYEELPYVSIVIEEAMKEFKAWLEEPEKNQAFDWREWRRQFDSADRTKVASALARLPKVKVHGEVSRLMALLTEDYPPRLRYQALLKLIEAKIDVPCRYAAEGIACEIVPSLLTLPEESFELQDFAERLAHHGFDPSKRELARELLLQYATAIFPMDPPYEDEEHLARALQYLVEQYLHQTPIPIDEVSQAMAGEIEAAILRFDAS